MLPIGPEDKALWVPTALCVLSRVGWGPALELWLRQAAVVLRGTTARRRVAEEKARPARRRGAEAGAGHFIDRRDGPARPGDFGEGAPSAARAVMWEARARAAAGAAADRSDWRCCCWAWTV